MLLYIEGYSFMGTQLFTLIEGFQIDTADGGCRNPKKQPPGCFIKPRK